MLNVVPNEKKHLFSTEQGPREPVTVEVPFFEVYLVIDHIKNRVSLNLLGLHYDFRKKYQNASEKYSKSQVLLKESVVSDTGNCGAE
jgi:hypothetical protein